MIDWWTDNNDSKKLFIDWFFGHDFVTRNSKSSPRYKRFTFQIGIFKRTLYIEIRLNKLPYTNYSEFVNYRKQQALKRKTNED